MKITIAILIILSLVCLSCSKRSPKNNKNNKEAYKEVEVACSNCNGTGTVVINVPELIAKARCQIYFANHMRECEICKIAVADDDMCDEARKKINDIMEEAKKQHDDIQEDQCPMCGGSGVLVEYKR